MEIVASKTTNNVYGFVVGMSEEEAKCFVQFLGSLSNQIVTELMESKSGEVVEATEETTATAKTVLFNIFDAMYDTVRDGGTHGRSTDHPEASFDEAL